MRTDAQVNALIVRVGDVVPRPFAASSKPGDQSYAGRTSGLVISALRYLGKQHITEDPIAHLRKTLSPKDRKRLISDLHYAPEWMHDALRQIAAD